jgi:hypothetical protein
MPVSLYLFTDPVPAHSRHQIAGPAAFPTLTLLPTARIGMPSSFAVTAYAWVRVA